MITNLAVVASVLSILSLELSIWIKRLAALVLIPSSPGDWLFDSDESYLEGFPKPRSSSE